MNLTWIKDFKQVMRINSKYEDPSAIVSVTISNYIKGMSFLIDKLDLKKDLQQLDNIVPLEGNNTEIHKAKVCSSYPTHLFRPS